METKVKTTALDLTNELKELIDKKIIKTAEKFLKRKDLTSALLEIELSRTTKHHREGKIWKCEVNLSLANVHLPVRAEAVSEDIKISIIQAKQNLERELRKLKTKRIDRFRKSN